MTRYILYLFLTILICFTSCFKDDITTTTTTEKDPVEIDGPLVTGQIVNSENKPQAGVLISIYAKDEKIGEITSDEEGKYHTADLIQSSSNQVTLEYKKSDYITDYKRFDFSNTLKQERSILLQKGIEIDKSGIQGDPNFELTNPSDSNLVKLYGYTLLSDGTPVTGVHLSVLWDYTVVGSFVIAQWQTEYSGTDGYFEFLVPKDKELLFYDYYRTSEVLFASCYFNFRESKNPAPWNSTFEILGSLDEDTQLEMRDDIDIQILNTTITGNALLCDGAPVQKGILRAGFLKDNFPFPLYMTVDSNYTFGSDGFFSVDIEACTNDNNFTGVAISIENEANDFSIINATLNDVDMPAMGTLYLCNDLRDYPDTLRINLNNQGTVLFPNGGDNPSSSKDAIWSGFTNSMGDLRESVYVIIEGLNTGNEKLKRLEMNKGKKEGNFIKIYETTFDIDPENHSLILDINYLPNDWIEGSISGNINTINGVQPIELTFKMFNK